MLGNNCVACGISEPHIGNYMCLRCKEKAKLVYTTMVGKVYSIGPKFVFIGLFGKDEVKHILDNL